MCVGVSQGSFRGFREHRNMLKLKREFWVFGFQLTTKTKSVCHNKSFFICHILGFSKALWW